MQAAAREARDLNAIFPRALLPRTAAASYIAGNAAERTARATRARMRRAVRCDQRRRLCCKRRCAGRRRALLRATWYHLERARAAIALRPNAEFYLKSPAAMRRLFAAVSRSDRSRPRNRASVAVSAGTFDRTVSALSGARGQLAASLSSRTRLRRRRAALSLRRSRPKSNASSNMSSGIIAKMDLAGYFLIVWDIVREAVRARAFFAKGAVRRRTRRSATRSELRRSIRLR